MRSTHEFCVHSHRRLQRKQTFVAESIHHRAYLSIGVTSSSGAGLCGSSGGGDSGGIGADMHDAAYELPRIPIPRTPVNSEGEAEAAERCGRFPVLAASASPSRLPAPPLAHLSCTSRPTTPSTQGNMALNSSSRSCS